MNGASFEQKNIQNTLKRQFRGRIDTLSRNIVTDDPLSCHQGHFRSWKVTSSFSGITFDRDQLERWKHHRCVPADDADRLICYMTFSGQVMTLTWGQIFNMTFQGQITYHSTRLDKRNTMMAKEIVCLYWVKSYYRKTFIAKTGCFWSFCSLEAKPLILDQIWGHISEKALKELSNALLRSTVAHNSSTNWRITRELLF